MSASCLADTIAIQGFVFISLTLQIKWSYKTASTHQAAAELQNQYQYNLRWVETGGRGSTGRLANHGSDVTLSSNAC